MSLPPLGTWTDRDRCDLCEQIVIRPVTYRGRTYHRLCAIKARRQDISVEIKAVYLDAVEREVAEILDAFPPARYPPETV